MKKIGRDALAVEFAFHVSASRVDMHSQIAVGLTLAGCSAPERYLRSTVTDEGDIFDFIDRHKYY